MQSLFKLFALIAKLVGELDDQDAVLRGEADQHDKADLRVDVERLACQPQAKQAAPYGHRHTYHDDDGVYPAFKLGGKHEEDDQKADSKHKHD